MPVQRTPSELADVILGMTHGDLMIVAGSFADMSAPDNGVRARPKSAVDFASLLHDWAEAQEDQ